ncbi:uncharacterized protein LOC141633924 [Silene latifolia]|uniref:uncharacterized protein LOC141633924 n=1 Tax=Silene latifolia TaxID=37657 RepID=UPI003D788E16
MDSPQPVVSPFKNLGVSSISISNATQNPKDFIGVLDVYVHQARDIKNICIYHKQDVYAKLCLTSHPQTTVSTHTINGGEQNPVFNDNVRLDVRSSEGSLRCEIWMFSRVKNYLEDQLLGFTLVPLSEILFKNGKVERELSLTSTDLFHSPAGFVQLSLAYSGSFPEIVTIPKIPSDTDNNVVKSEAVGSDFDNIEFPDPKLMNENQMMVSEYIGVECSLDSQTAESLVSSDTESYELGVRVVESFSQADSSPSSVLTNETPSICFPTSSQSSETQVTSESPNQEHISPAKDINKDSGEGEGESYDGQTPSKETLLKPLVTVNIEPEKQMVQQDIVDMYMKSMQQFTDSLAKMKLPMDITPEPAKSDHTSETLKNNGSRVFYGSRAFF